MNNTNLMYHYHLSTNEFRDNNRIIDTLFNHCRVKKKGLDI